MITFDTSILVDIEKGNKNTVKKLAELTATHAGPALLLFIPYFEFYRGLNVNAPERLEKGGAFLKKFTFVQPTKKTAELLVRLRTKYDATGNSLHLADLIIASQVQEHNLVLVTKDTDFERIDEIRKIVLK